MRRADGDHVPADGRANRPSTRRLVSAALVTLVILAALAYLVERAARPPTPAAELYMSALSDDGTQPGPFRPLDPLTLADREGGTPLNPADVFTRVVSADSSTAVELEWETWRQTGGPLLLSVHDGRSGELRTRFPLPERAIAPRLSHDGRRVVVWQTQEPPWYVLDTATGRLVATIPADGRRTWAGFLDFIFDPAAVRGYHLLLPDEVWSRIAAETQPRPAWLIAYDLITGAEVGRRELPLVRGGRWRTTQTAATGEPVPAAVSPTMVLSPDGRQLAVVHGDVDAVTLVATDGLVVGPTVYLTRAPGLPPPTPLVQLVGEPLAGRWRTPGAIYAPDGRHLYVYGGESQIDTYGIGRAQALPLRRVDLARGVVTAEAAPDPDLAHVLPAPDGRSVYVVSYHWRQDEQRGDTWLRRLDAVTLRVLAERQFRGFQHPLLRPVGAIDRW